MSAVLPKVDTLSICEICKKKTWRVSLSISVRITVIHCVVYLLRILKMFHGLMNNPVLPWQMLMLLLCRCWCLLVLARMCESGRRRNSSLPAIKHPLDWILAVLHPALTAQCLLVRLLQDSLWRMLRDTEQMMCGKATMVSKWGDLAVSPLRNGCRNALGHLLTEV